MADAADVTALLVAWTSGDEAARDRLFEAVYDELRRLARGRLRRERPDLSLAPTALVHEAYLKLIDQRRVHWQNRSHFYSIAGHVMRRILVDHARARAAAKRGGHARIPLDDISRLIGPGTFTLERFQPTYTKPVAPNAPPTAAAGSGPMLAPGMIAQADANYSPGTTSRLCTCA